MSVAESCQISLSLKKASPPTPQKKKNTKHLGEKNSTGYAELSPQIKTQILWFIVNIIVTQKYRAYRPVSCQKPTTVTWSHFNIKKH